MLKEYICDKCGTPTWADPDTEAVVESRVLKQTGITQRSITCDVCRSVLYRDVERDGRTHVLFPLDAADGAVKVTQIGEGAQATVVVRDADDE